MNETNPNFIRQNADNSNIISLNKGKVPPQVIDLEIDVLGAMLIDKKGVDEVIDILHPEAFYLPAHQNIFKAIRTLFEEGQAIDLHTVSNQLKKMSKLDIIGGDHYLIELTQKVVSSAHITPHAFIILQKHIQRRLITISGEINQLAYDDSKDVFNILDEVESKLYDITQKNTKEAAKEAKGLVIEAKKKIEETATKEGLSGVPSGFEMIDKITTGWQNSDLIVIAARPGMGKTAFVLSMAKNIAVDNKTPVAFFSLEMPAIQLMMRLISSETKIHSEKLRTGKLEKHEWAHLNDGVTSLESAPLFIDDTPSLSIFDLRAKARRLVSQHGIKIIIIDYLQLMTVSIKNGNREQEIATISRNLKSLAKELDIPIIALAQLSRAVEVRGGTKRPLLSDLRESGAIEQDADIVSFIFRPEYYKMEQWDDEDASPTKGEAEFIISKHRNGGLGNIRLRFLQNLGKFENKESFDSGIYNSKMNNVKLDAKYNSSPNEAFDDNFDNNGVPF